MKALNTLLAVIAAATVTTACNWVTDDLVDCPQGLYLKFKYDYNLQRADMFNDHVGTVTAYIYDANDKLVKTQTEYNSSAAQPLADPTYRMIVEGLEPGDYRVIALAQQSNESLSAVDERAKFVRSIGNTFTDPEIVLDHTKAASGDYYLVENNALPLDTLWHGIETDYITIPANDSISHTISLVRDTKKINITLREVADPTIMDVDKYGFTITDHNAHILYNNALDETDCVVYTPYATWNTYDRDDEDYSESDIEAAKTRADADTEGVGGSAHADCMTSRLLYHNDGGDDAVLSITELETGNEIVCVNLADMLSRLRTYADYIYTRQQFLDRGYDYQLHFYLINGEFSYVDIEIAVLSWSVRVMYTSLN